MDDVVQLANTSAHVFRHTFRSRAIARDMPTDLVQPILGHASTQPGLRSRFLLTEHVHEGTRSG
ncbi:tyrosine-type recombinase/integrase [Caballeronia humi]|uniref:tyrosine-type recombinase/integrase n=1 Tax=Caballeronia humi TaxID=326474 RepID=UPI000B3E8BE1|nr:tyrosine-type recombinase/integrase [Caballeronia humi]